MPFDAARSGASAAPVDYVGSDARAVPFDSAGSGGPAASFGSAGLVERAGSDEFARPFESARSAEPVAPFESDGPVDYIGSDERAVPLESAGSGGLGAQFGTAGLADSVESLAPLESSGPDVSAEPAELDWAARWSGSASVSAFATPTETADYLGEPENFTAEPAVFSAESAVYPANLAPMESADEVESVVPPVSSWSTTAAEVGTATDSPAVSEASSAWERSFETAVPSAYAVPDGSADPGAPLWTSALPEASAAEAAEASVAAPTVSASDEPVLRADRDLHELFGFGTDAQPDVGSYWTPDEPAEATHDEPEAIAEPAEAESPAFEPALAWRSLGDLEAAPQSEPDPVVPPSIGRVRAAVRVPGLTIEPPPAASASVEEKAPEVKAPEVEAPDVRASEADMAAVDAPESVTSAASAAPAANISEDEDRPLAVPRAIDSSAPPHSGAVAPPVQPPPAAPLVNYSVEDWRSNVRGSAVVSVEAAGTVYRGELGGPDEPEPISTTQKVLRYAVVTILLALFVLAFLYGPKIDEWFGG